MVVDAILNGVVIDGAGVALALFTFSRLFYTLLLYCYSCCYSYAVVVVSATLAPDAVVVAVVVVAAFYHICGVRFKFVLL